MKELSCIATCHSVHTVVNSAWVKTPNRNHEDTGVQKPVHVMWEQERGSYFNACPAPHDLVIRHLYSDPARKCKSIEAVSDNTSKIYKATSRKRGPPAHCLFTESHLAACLGTSAAKPSETCTVFCPRPSFSPTTHFSFLVTATTAPLPHLTSPPHTHTQCSLTL